MSMAHPGMRLRALLAGLLGLTLLWAAQPALGKAAPADPAVVGYPNAIAATGDSITRAFNTGTFPFTDAPANSWSTGTNNTVLTHYLRILAAHPAISGHTNNDAVTGAQMTDLAGQVTNVNSQGVDYVTILLGANDACTATEAAMTPVATYRAQFQAALAALSAGSPNARIFVLSVPDIYNLWNILHNDASARSTWALFSICQSVLANPTSTDPLDVARRARVRQRVVDYNTQLAEVCGAYIHCRFDNNAVFNTAFLPSDVSTRDYFHPTIAGQTKLAQGSWAATYDFTDQVAPLSWRGISSSSGLVVLNASDNVGVAGIEYKIDGGPYTRYSGPISVAPGITVVYRAVDVNGNSEASHTLTLP